MTKQRTLTDSLAEEIRAQVLGTSQGGCPMRRIPQPLRGALYANARDTSVSIRGLAKAAADRGAKVSREKLEKIRVGICCEGCICEADA